MKKYLLAAAFALSFGGGVAYAGPVDYYNDANGNHHSVEHNADGSIVVDGNHTYGQADGLDAARRDYDLVGGPMYSPDYGTDPTTEGNQSPEQAESPDTDDSSADDASDDGDGDADGGGDGGDGEGDDGGE